MVTARGTPAAEVAVDEPLVRRLLNEQFPELAREPLRQVAHGWDNVTYRLGAALAVRLPRRSLAVPLLEHEQRWLPTIARNATLPVPAPLHCGRPGAGFPWSWSVVPWIEGAMAAEQPPAPEQAAVLGRFLASVHRPAPADAPRNPYRGCPLGARAEAFEERCGQLSSQRFEAELLQLARACFEAAVQAPGEAVPVWIHGDLHPKNIVVRAGVLAGVIDWGDVTAGDRATDLSAVYSLFEPADWPSLWRSYGADSPALRQRARGWAAYFAVIWSSIADDLTFMRLGRTTLRRLAVAEPADVTED